VIPSAPSIGISNKFHPRQKGKNETFPASFHFKKYISILKVDFSIPLPPLSSSIWVFDPEL
jgi:hypothetical protein